MRYKTVLVTGAGGIPATNFIRSLRASKATNFYIIGTECSPYAIQRAETDECFWIPPCDSPDYLPALKRIIKNQDVDFLHCQNDKEMSVISRYRDELPTQTYLPSKKTVDNCHNKLESNRLWVNANVPTPKTYWINSSQYLETIMDQLNWDEYWLRPYENTAGGRGSLRTKSFMMANAWIEHNKGWGHYTLSKALTERTVTWMSIWHEGKLAVAQGRERAYWELGASSPSGVTGCTGAGITVSDALVDDTARRAVLAVDSEPHGLFGVDMCYDKKDIPNVTEINIGRFFTTIDFFTKAGLNMPDIYMNIAMGVYKVQEMVNPLDEGLVWIRGVDKEPTLTTKAVIEGFNYA